MSGVQPEHIDAFWDEAAPFIERAIPEGSLVSLEGVYTRLKAQRHQLWFLTERHHLKAVVVTEIRQYDLGRALEVLYLSGEGMEDWIKGLEGVLASFGREENCDYIMQDGRKGWLRTLRTLGWEEMNTRMIRRL